MPGLLTAVPPKRPARGRENDCLFSYLALSSNAPFSSAEYHQLSSMLVERFYKTPGSLTSALRAAADVLNQTLVERNLRTTGKGHFVLGRLVFGVLREAQAFIGQCGPIQIFHLSSADTHRIQADQLAGRGLGTSQSTAIHYAQIELHPGDILAMCSSLPSGWEEFLLAERNSHLDPLRRKLLSLSTEDLNAVLMQAKTGKGILTVLHPLQPAEKAVATPSPEARVAQPAASSPVAAVVEQPAAQPRPVSQVASEQPANRFTNLVSGLEAGKSPAEEKAGVESDSPAVESTSEAGENANIPRRVIPRPASTLPATKDSRPRQFIGSREGRELPEIVRPDSVKRQQVFRGLAKWLRGVRVVSHNTSEKIRAFLPTLLPNLRDEEPRVSSTSLAFIAIAIPVLIVTMALIFYNQHGKTASYQENYDLAFASAAWASGQTSPADIRVGWERTLYYLDSAEGYKKTGDSQSLRLQAQTALDNLDNIMRLDFGPAIVGGLSRTMNVTRMAATSTDLYLLDGTRGAVSRFYASVQGYHVDGDFVCQPGTVDGITVGTLIDIIAAPKVNPYKATLMALDSNGALIYCASSPSKPKGIQLSPPEMGWSDIAAFTIDETTGYLYILDPARNAIWYYMPDEEGKFSLPPKMFFGEQVPGDMNSVIDLATNGADMYLLHTDGHVTACTLVEFQGVPKRCADPAQFVDNRPEHQSGVKIADATFSSMTFTDAPDQTLYFFEPYTQAVYRFSARPDLLVLLGQFRAPEDQRAAMLAETATAMALSPNRSLFIAISGQVYYTADLP